MTSVRTDTRPEQAAAPRRSSSPWRAVVGFIGANKGLMLGVLLLALLLGACLGAPLLTPYSPTQQNFSAVLLPPSSTHYFGTDQYGRDVFARALYAGRIDFLIGLVLVGVASVVGTIMGMIAGWYGGVTETVVMRTVDIGLAFPFLVLVISIVGLRGPGLSSLFLAVCVVAWIFYARLVRGQVLALKSSNFILAARMSDFSTARILGRHVLPNVVAQVVVYMSSDFVYAVLLGASVSYLGLGVQPPTPEWGAMIQEGQNFVSVQWWLTAFPGLAIVLVGIAFSLMGDGFADLLRTGSET